MECERFPRKTRIAAEEMFYSHSKGEKESILRGRGPVEVRTGVYSYLR
jgi:hypothetical protein